MKRARGIVKGIGDDGMIRFAPYRSFEWELEGEDDPLKYAQAHDEVTVTSGQHTIKVYGKCIESLRDALVRICGKRFVERHETAS